LQDIGVGRRSHLFLNYLGRMVVGEIRPTACGLR
jgi:hypothetical protein